MQFAITPTEHGEKWLHRFIDFASTQGLSFKVLQKVNVGSLEIAPSSPNSAGGWCPKVSPSEIFIPCSGLLRSARTAASTTDVLPKIKENATKAVINFFITYFFLYPDGHLGFTAVTFLVVLPFTQVIEVFLSAIGAAIGVGIADVAGFGAATS